MVRVEPFFFQMMTAFKERLQMANKINEIIDVLNNGTMDEETVRAMIEEELLNYYPRSEVYTKTEVDTSLSEKQNNLTVGQGLSLVDDELDLTGWEMIPIDEWEALNRGPNNRVFKFDEDIRVVFVLPTGHIDQSNEVVEYIFCKDVTYKDWYLYKEVSYYSNQITTNQLDNYVGVARVYLNLDDSVTSYSLSVTGLFLKRSSDSSYYTINCNDVSMGSIHKYYDADGIIPPYTTQLSYGIIALLRRKS